MTTRPTWSDAFTSLRERRLLQIWPTYSPRWLIIMLLACELAAGIAPVQSLAQTGSEVVLHNFSAPPKGALPDGVIRDSAGNLYGAAAQGGSSNAGVVYKLYPTGQATVLYSFTGGTDGGVPSGGIIRDSAGNLYGTTNRGGSAGCYGSGCGVVYKVDTNGHETVLYSFSGGADGGSPNGSLVRDSAGNLYGTTYSGGSAGCYGSGCGVVYKVDATGKETVLYTFTGGADGGFPNAGVIRDTAGNLYGTTPSGGGGTACFGGGCGVVYRLDTTGHETVLYTFTGGADGGTPYARVIRDSAGNLYGTTSYNGAAGWGVVYKVDPTGHETVLYAFTGAADGGRPEAGVTRDTAGNLYGTASYGGISGGFCASGCGVVYKLDTTGHETALYSFTGAADGGYPIGGVVRDSAGNLYGTTDGNYLGGVYGVVYKVDATGHETVLYTFTSGTDGMNPAAGLVRDSAGNFYGTTSSGGTHGAGTVYKLSPAGQETVLYAFTGGADGSSPSVGVVRDSAGNLYGTTTVGGISGGSCSSGCGVVYKLDTSGQETVLYAFTGGSDGEYPYAGVIRDSAGSLYGTTVSGGSSTGCYFVFTGCGVVYKLDAAGHETVLHSFTGADGGNPYAGVILDSAGNLYGTTIYGGSAYLGVVYELDPSGQETVLYSFPGIDTDGMQPYAGVTRDSAGNLYGTAQGGNSVCSGLSCGVVYKLDTSGHETVLHSFTGGADGGSPFGNAGLIFDSGALYGTAVSGGNTGCPGGGCGVVYMLSVTGQFTALYSFTGAADGGRPEAGVIRDSSGNLYGTTFYGGKHNVGAVFKVTPPPSACGVLDVSSQTTVIPGSFTYIPPALYEYSQTISVTYNGAGSVPTAYLVLRGEPTAKVFLQGTQLETHCFSSSGDYLIPVGNLQAGQQVQIPLVWVTNDVPSTGITYTTKVLNGLPGK